MTSETLNTPLASKIGENRERIHQIIEKSLEHPLISVQAGSGYNKASSMEQFFQSSDFNYMYIRINSLDNLPEQFWKKLVQTISIKDKAFSFALLRTGFPEGRSEFKNVLDIILKHLESDKITCLIFDDYHYIIEPIIQKFISQLAVENLANLKLILMTSKDQIPFYQELNEKKLLSSISEHDLRFTEAEVKAYMKDQGIHLQDSQLDAIYHYTHGLTMAIQLVAISIKNGNSYDYLKSELETLTNHLVEHELFESYSENMQETLAAISHFDTIPVFLITDLTNTSMAELDQIVSRNPFMRYSQTKDMIYLHSLFGDYLRNKQKALPETTTRIYLQNMAEWYHKNDYVHEAIHFYKLCRNYKMIIVQMQHYLNAHMTQPLTMYLIDLLQEIPADFKLENPIVDFYFAFLLFHNLEIESAFEKLLLLEQMAVSTAASPDYNLLGEIYLLLGIIRFNQKESDFESYFAKASDYLPEGSKIFDQSFPIIDTNNVFNCKNLTHEYIDRMLISYQKGFTHFTRLTHGCAAGIIDLAKAEVAYFKRDRSTSEKMALTALAQASNMSQEILVANCYYILIRLQVLEGNYEKLIFYANKLKAQTNTSHFNHDSTVTQELLLAWFYMKMDDFEKIPHWIYEYSAHEQLIAPLYAGRNLVLYAVLLLYSEKYNELLQYLDKAQEICEQNKALLTLIFVYHMKSGLYFINKDMKNGLYYTEKAYQLISDSKFFVFYEEAGGLFDLTYNALIAYDKEIIPKNLLAQFKEMAIAYDHSQKKLQALYKEDIEQMKKRTPI